MQPMQLGDTLLVSLVGMCIVFFGLVVLMIAIKVQHAAFKTISGKQSASQAPDVVLPTPAPAAPATAKPRELAPGRSGEIHLYDVDDQTAALIMAIVADEMKAPVNELKFISIKEV